jgi:hypothetical protein
MKRFLESMKSFCVVDKFSIDIFLNGGFDVALIRYNRLNFQPTNVPITPKAINTSGDSSVLNFRTSTWPLYFSLIFVKEGFIAWQGRHQDAHRSTTTGQGLFDTNL